MPRSQIENVYIIADCGAVVGGIIYDGLVNALKRNNYRGEGVPVPKTCNLSRKPTATWPRRGSRLNGIPQGSSPIIPLGWAPAGLK